MRATFHLNEDLRICQETEARFLDTCSETGLFIQYHLLSPFDSETAQAAETLAQKTPTIPVGAPNAPSETKSIVGYEFQAGTGCWECTRRDCTIILHPETDIKDTELLLQTFQPIEEKILGRKLAGKDSIHIEIGVPQWKNAHHVAVANSKGSPQKISFFLTKSEGGHILAAQIEKSVGITCEKIILHEIGHLLEPLLNHHLRGIQQSLLDQFDHSREFLEKTSPHYLAKQFAGISRKNGFLRKIRNQNSESFEMGGETYNTQPFLNRYCGKIADEIFAETIRVCYLEGCLEKTPPSPQTKTGWDALDSLIETLHSEMLLTHSKEKPSTPPFPKTQPYPDFSP